MVNMCQHFFLKKLIFFHVIFKIIMDNSVKRWFDMTLYDNIKTLRENLKMSQDELARKVGYKDRTSIAKIESGKIDLAQSKIFAFAKALNVSPEELMGLKYYDDPFVSEYAEIVRQNPDLRLLFDASKDMSKDDIDFVIHAINILKKKG